MGNSKFSINSRNIKNPSGFSIERYTLTESTRIANGDMVMDFVANKRKFQFTYAAITSTDLNVIIEELWSDLVTSHNCFHTLVYTDELNVSKSVTVYAGAIPTTLHRADGKEWVWKDVSFSLIER